MQVRIREASPQEHWLMRADLMWQPTNSKNGRWYPIRWHQIQHVDAETRREVLNACYTGHVTTVCQGKYDRQKHVLTILAPRG